MRSPAFNSALFHWGVLSAGRDYACVAIMGCQSSGKSTLLNMLFGTEFKTMNAQVRRAAAAGSGGRRAGSGSR